MNPSVQRPGPRRAVRQRLSLLRSVLFFAPCYFAVTAAYGTVSLVCSLRDRDGSRQHRIARAWARQLLRIARVRVTIEGREHLEAMLAAGQAFVMVANHLSFMDVPVLFANLPLQFRILARKGLFQVPFLGGHLHRGRHLPVDQQSPSAALRSLIQAARSVAAGLPVFVFPEAGRSFTGELRDFMPGAFFLAVHAQVPILPMVLAGTRELLPPGTMHLRPGAVTLAFAPPITTRGLARDAAPALAARTCAAMRAMYARLRAR